MADGLCVLSCGDFVFAFSMSLNGGKIFHCKIEYMNLYWCRWVFGYAFLTDIEVK